MIDWLLAHGGPAIRYRTMTELTAETSDLATYETALLESPLTQAWLHRFGRDTSLNAVHGAKHTCYENVMGKLTQLGCRAGMPPLDAKTQFYRDWLHTEAALFADVFYTRLIVAAFLLRAGYHQDQPARLLAQQRLHVLAQFLPAGHLRHLRGLCRVPGHPPKPTAIMPWWTRTCMRMVRCACPIGMIW
jgi:hypothetical protein